MLSERPASLGGNHSYWGRFKGGKVKGEASLLGPRLTDAVWMLVAAWGLEPGYDCRACVGSATGGAVCVGAEHQLYQEQRALRGTRLPKALAGCSGPKCRTAGVRVMASAGPAATKLTLPALWSPLVDSAALRAHRAAFPARLGRNSRGGQVNIYRAVAVGFRDLSMIMWVRWAHWGI